MSVAMDVIRELESRGFKKIAGEYRGNSPFRPGSDSGSFAVTIDELNDTGAWYDHKSEDSGSLYDLASKLGIPIPVSERPQPENTKREYKTLAEYAELHGVPVEVFESAQWEVSEWNNRPCFKYPTAGGYRVRFIDGDPDKPKFKPMGTGIEICWYGLKTAIPMAQNQNLPLVICNGEPSTIVAQHFGIPACCKTGGEKALPQNLLDQLNAAWKGPVIIALDCDDKGRQTAQKIKQQIPRAHIADLGLGNKGDLADFCKLHEQTAMGELQTLVKNAQVQVTPAQTDELNALLKTLVELERGNGHTPDAPEIIARAQKQLDMLNEKYNGDGNLVSFMHAGSELLEHVQWAIENPGKIKGLSFGVPTLNKMTWGAEGGKTYVVYGDTNMGKSTLVTGFASVFMSQEPGIVMATEAGTKRWLSKVIAYRMRTPSSNIMRGNLTTEQFNELVTITGEVAAPHHNFIDGAYPSIGNVISGVHEAMEKHGAKWLVVDSINNMVAPGTAGIYDRISACADGLQALAISCDIPIIITSQVGRKPTNRGKNGFMPRLHDAEGSGRVEQNADYVMSVYRHDYYKNENPDLEPMERCPEGGAVVTCLKDRDYDSIGDYVPMVFVGGAGLYEMEQFRGQ